ncbi:MAG: hypothetical protein IKQ44_00930 [Lachnospiraceae bacterium]|nr:hypothetical protein [Lachnospiraceae bacterium]
MAFMSMVFASLFVGFILIGWLFLLIGIILNIIRHVKKRKDKEVSRMLIISARVFIVWGLIQGIGPIAVIAVMILLSM